MPLGHSQKIIITSSDGTKRRTLPGKQISDGTCRIERAGGMSSFTVNTLLQFSGGALPTIILGDRVEFYYNKVLRFRGWIEERGRVLDEPNRLALTGFGLSFLLRQQFCYGRYVYPGLGRDLSAA